MNVEAHTFNFTDAYRALQPSASREVVAARESSHGELLKQMKLATHVLDLCRLAFGLTIPTQSELGSLFVTEVRKGDPQFSLTHDRAEAGRIAALLLADRLARGSTQDAIAVLATSFAGQRDSADENGLTDLAGHCLASSARGRRHATNQPTPITYSKAPDRSSLIAALDQGVTPPAVKAILEAIVADGQTGGEGLAKVVTTVLQGLFNEAQRLAEEVDLLWWHIGDWSECLNRPIGQVPEAGRGLIAGADLAAMIRVLPGPYGTAGILRRSLGHDAEQSMTLREAVEALEPDDLKRAYANCADTDILPVHTAVQLSLDRGRGAWGPAFEKLCGVKAEAPLTRYKIALQAFWERSLVKHGWAK